MPQGGISQLLIPAASAVFGGLLVAFVTGLFNLRTKRNEFVNDYYREVIRRRVEAYDFLEKLIVSYKSSVMDKDCKPYHTPFATEKQGDAALVNLCLAMDRGLWIREETFAKLTELNYLVFRTPESAKERVEFGKAHHVEIAVLRADLERMMAADLLDLHNVRKFLLHKKRTKGGFKPVQLYPPEQ